MGMSKPNMGLDFTYYLFVTWYPSSFDDTMGDFSEKIILGSQRKVWTETWFPGIFEVTATVSYPRRARSALGVDTVLTLDVYLYVCMYVC